MPNLKSLDLSLQSFDQYYTPRFPHLPLLEEYTFRDTNFGAKLPFDDGVLGTIRTLTCETNSWAAGDGETISKFQNITVLRLCNFTAASYTRPNLSVPDRTPTRSDAPSMRVYTYIWVPSPSLYPKGNLGVQPHERGGIAVPNGGPAYTLESTRGRTATS
jgi:hypothetical protein